MGLLDFVLGSAPAPAPLGRYAPNGAYPAAMPLGRSEMGGPSAPAAQPLGATPAASGGMQPFQQVIGAGAGWTQVRLADGSVVRLDGSRNWRNNNPGNIEFGDFARSHGAIGTDGRFAVFPTYDAGQAAREALLFDSPGYRGLTLAGAIHRYAPPSENNTGSYIAQVARAAGVDPNTPLSSLSPEQRHAMLAAMQEVEGFRPGTINGDPAPITASAGGSGSDTPMGSTAPRGLLGQNDRVSTMGGLLSSPAPLTDMPAPERRSSIFDRFEGRGGLLGALADPERRARLAIALGSLSHRPPQAAMDMAKQDIQDARDTERMQRVAAWLQQNGGGDWAAALAAGIDPAQAVGGFMQDRQPQEPPRPVIEGGMVFDPVTGEMIHDYRQPGEGAQRRIVEQGGVQYWADTGEPVLPNAPAPAASEGPETWAPISAADAAARGLPAGGVYELSSRGQTRVVTPAPEGKGGPDLGDQTQFQNAYRGDATVQRMQGAADAYGTLHAAAQSNTPSDNIAFVYAFMKMLDPGSVVRETEAGMVAQSGSIDTRVMNVINGVLNGETMTADQKAEFLRTAENIYNDAVSAYAPVYDHYSALAGTNMLPQEAYPIDYRRTWAPIQFEARQDAAPNGFQPSAPSAAPADTSNLSDDELLRMYGSP